MNGKERLADLEDDLEQDLILSEQCSPNCCFMKKGEENSPTQFSPQAEQEQGRGWGLAWAPAPEQRLWVTVILMMRVCTCDGASGGQSEVTGMQLGCTH